MISQFNQPRGSTSIEVNKQSIARNFGVKEDEVVYFTAGIDLGGFKVIYDESTQRAYSLPSGIVSGTTAISLNEQAILVHSAGTVDLGELAATHREFVNLSDTFATGLVVNTRNELLFHNGIGYTYLGSLPVTIPAGINPVGNADWKPQTDTDLRSDLMASSSGLIVDASNIFIKASSPGTKDVPLNVFAGQMVSLLNFPGVVADGITDTRAGVQAAIDACALAGVTLYIPDGVYAFGNFFTQPSNSKLVFGENAWFKLLNNTTWPGLGGIGHFHNTGTNYNDFLNTDGETIKYVEATNVVTIGMKLDCNNIDGENGITSAWGSNIRHIRPIVKNTVHTNTLLGGRAFQFEGNLNQDIVVTDATILDCSIGCNSQGLAGSTTANTRAVTYDGIFMKNVGVPFNIYGQVANPETADARIQSVTVYNATLHNCGAPQAPFAGSLDGGIICGDRGAGLNIYGLRLVNDESYGGIGAVFRGGYL